ncbi:hypothetical protein GQ457_02G001470 [Hibiscus cannabinus]
MGKKGGNSWLTAVKRAFRSPTKDTANDKKSNRHDQQDDDEEKKREKRRWIFRKSTSQETVTTQQTPVKSVTSAAEAEKRHAIAVAMAKAAAEAAVSTARLTKPVYGRRPSVCCHCYSDSFSRLPGEKSSSRAKRISEVASFSERPQCEKASKDDTPVYASSG